MSSAARETESWSFTVPGRPVPAARMTQRSKYRKGGREERHLAHMGSIAWLARAAQIRPIEGPVRLSCLFYVSGRQPDLKNLVALVEDALAEIAYQNDVQVSEYGCMRRIPCGPAEERTEIVIERVVHVAKRPPRRPRGEVRNG